MKKNKDLKTLQKNGGADKKDVKLENNLQEISRIYIMGPDYCVSGGSALYCRIIEYLLKYTNIKIGIIDFNDGIFIRTCQKFFPNQQIEYVDYNDSFWYLEDDSVIVTAADHIGCIKPHSGKNIKVSAIVWETGIHWPTLFEKKKISEIANLLEKTNALCSTDYGCYIAACMSLKRIFEKKYFPIFYQQPKYKIYCKTTLEDEINLVWLGRIAEAKLFSIYNIIENFYKYKTIKKKKFHIIGNGGCVDVLKEHCKKYADEIEFIFTGILTGDNLFAYLQKNTDVGVAMGTSMLNFASLKIPVMAAHEYNKPFFTNEFGWGYDMYEYCTGSPVLKNNVTLPMFANLSTFDVMLDAVSLHKQGEFIGKKCFQYYKQKHGDIKNVVDAFLHCVKTTKLTCEQLKKTLKFMPYNDVWGIAVHYFNVLGLRFKVVHHQNKRRVYFGKICLTKFVYVPGGIKFYVLGLRLLKTRWWGRYSFPSSTSEWIKVECKDKYAINELLFKD